jgi:outer membrane protein assembly factor BamD (BamD/ComL family)
MQDTDAPPTPASPEEDIEVAEYYIRKGDPDAAIPRLEEVIQLRPKLAKPRLMLAEIYEKRGDAPDAIKCYKEYLQVFPSAPDAKKIEKKIEKLTNR